VTIEPNLPAVLPADPVPSAELKHAARDFEALLLSQILKSATQSSSGGGWMGTGDDEAGQQVLALAQEQFALALSSGGGLGLTEMITQSVTIQQSQKAPDHLLPIAKAR
jgi:Rod binding domain-containing protein